MKRTHLIILLSLLGLGLCAGGAFFAFKGSEYKIELTQAQLQAAIDEKLPYRKPFALIFDLTFSNTKVVLDEGSERVGASTDVNLNIKLSEQAQNLGGFIRSETGIRYDQKTFSFYIMDPIVHEVTIQGIPEKYTQKVAAGAKPVAQKYLSDVRVYRIKDNNLKLKLAKAVLKKIEVVDGKLVLTLGY